MSDRRHVVRLRSRFDEHEGHGCDAEATRHSERLAAFVIRNSSWWPAFTPSHRTDLDESDFDPLASQALLKKGHELIVADAQQVGYISFTKSFMLLRPVARLAS